MNLNKAASALGRKGGSVKSLRKTDACRNNAKKGGRPAVRRAFLATFAQLSPEAKAEQFQRHGLTGANQTALHLWVHIQAKRK